jgi:hypothetical protein
MSYHRLALIALLALAGSCSDSLSPTGKQAELSAARQRWTSKYRFTMRRLCFCINTNPLEVSVAHGNVVQVYDQTQKNTVDVKLGQTVDQLFDFVDGAIRAGAATIEVTYDPVLGFPTLITYDGSVTIADDELTITAGGMQQGIVVR